MCTFAIAATAATAVSGVTGAIGNYQSAQSKAAYYNYQARQAEIQAAAEEKTAKLQSRAIQDRAKFDSKDLASRHIQFAATQKAALVANGIDPSSVTAEDITTDTFNKQNLDEIALRYNADVKSWEVKTQGDYNAFTYRQQADQFRYASSATKSAARTNLGSSLLGTVAKSFLTYNSFGKLPAPKPINIGSGTNSYGVNITKRYAFR